MGSKHYIIPIFVPHLGCPHDCVFCNQKRITGVSTNISKEDVRDIIDESLKTIPEGREKLELAFYGGSFTGIEKAIQKELLEVPYRYKKEGIIDEIRLSTRPDYIDFEILKLLKGFKLDTIELGVQSLDDGVLKFSGRGHTKEKVYEAIDLIRKFNFKLGLQMMVGLPGDTYEKTLFTVKQIIKQNPDCVRIYPTLVIKDTYLEASYIKGEYSPLSLEEAVDISTVLLMLFDYYKINVIRVGLQPTEKINLGKDVVAGPFHPAFRQLVEGNIYKLILDRYFKKMDKFLIDGEKLVIEVNKREVSNLSGQKSRNIKYLKKKFKFKDIKIYGTELPKNRLKISLDSVYDTIDKDEIIRDYLLENNLTI